jgi:hypothetical protein
MPMNAADRDEGDGKPGEDVANMILMQGRRLEEVQRNVEKINGDTCVLTSACSIMGCLTCAFYH